MKIAVTGHTSGIGKSIYELLIKQGHDVTGFSRQTGFDLLELKHDKPNKQKMAKFIKSIKDYDIFINNACYEFMQVEILYELFEVWRKVDKTIINIGSVSGDKSKGEPHEYQIHKVALDKACQQLETMGKCKVVNIRPGWVDTPAIAEFKKYIGIGIRPLEPDYIAEVVSQIINLPRHIHIKSISIEPWYNGRVKK